MTTSRTAKMMVTVVALGLAIFVSGALSTSQFLPLSTGLAEASQIYIPTPSDIGPNADIGGDGYYDECTGTDDSAGPEEYPFDGPCYQHDVCRGAVGNAPPARAAAIQCHEQFYTNMINVCYAPSTAGDLNPCLNWAYTYYFGVMQYNTPGSHPLYIGPNALPDPPAIDRYPYL